MSDNRYKTIAKSSGVIGLVQIVKMIFGLIQNKVLALLIGPSGFGVWGLYNSFVEMVNSFSTLGIDSSGVREIAKTDNEDEVSKIAWVIKNTLLLLSIIVSLSCIVFSKRISEIIFGDNNYYIGVIIVSFSFILTSLSKARMTILNGRRYIRELALSQIFGYLLSTVIIIGLAFLLKEDVVPYMFLLMPAFLVVFTSFYIQKLGIKYRISILPEYKTIVKNLMYIGAGYTVSALIGAVMNFASRQFIASEYGMDTLGIYQSCWTISNVYVGTILTAMGVDFVPRLMKVISNKIETNKIITEQLEFSILLASAGIIPMMAFSSYILHILYSSEFIVGSYIIKYQLIGVSLRVYGFVFGYVIMAYQKPIMFVLTQTIVFVLDYVFLVLLSSLWGYESLGLNYVISYLVYTIITLFLCKKKFDLQLSPMLLKIILLSIAFIVLSYCITTLPGGLILGILLSVIYAFIAYVILKKYMGINVLGLFKRRIIR